MKKAQLFLFSGLIFSINSFAESRSKIVVIDSGYTHPTVSKNESLPSFCRDGLLNTNGRTVAETGKGHGTNIIGTISQGIDFTKFCIVSINYYLDPDSKDIVMDSVPKALDLALTLTPKMVVMALEGQLPDIKEAIGIRRLLDLGSVVVVAAGNKRKNLTTDCSAYPACYMFRDKNFVVVSALDGNGHIDRSYANYGGPVDAYVTGASSFGGYSMRGTSQATANLANMILTGKTQVWSIK